MEYRYARYLYDGRRFRLLNIIDDYNRECVAMEIASSISSKREVRVLDQIKEDGRIPKQMRIDNGLEFFAGILQYWRHANQIKLIYIQPGKPLQNTYIECFKGACTKELGQVCF